ncbi:MAG: sulfatase activating formylglycine-generating enzyme [Bacteroidia bacterium]|jgi:formylglycine-generating enzyme required for sulfatase activity
MFEGVAVVITAPKRGLTSVSATLLVLSMLTAGVLFALWWSTPLLIVATPPSASVSVSGFAPKIGSSFVVLPGNYTIVAEAVGYYPYTAGVEVVHGDSQSFDLLMLPLPGRLHVDSAIPQLEVAVDGLVLEQELPGIITGLEPGTHVFRFDHPRFFAKDIAFEVEGFDRLQTLEVTLDPAWGQLLLTSTPQAEVKVDGQLIGTTPLTAEILQTGSDVVLIAPGFNLWKETLSVAAGESKDWPEIKLTPADGQLTVTSEPAGASVTLANQYAGVTPLTAAVPSGKAVSVKVLLQGYYAATKSIQLEPQEKDSLAITLRPEKGEIELEVFPIDSRVYIDGQLQGQGLQRLSLLAKPHTIEVRKEGYVSHKQTIVPRPSLSQSLNIKLLTQQQQYWLAFPDNVTAPTGISMRLMRPEAEFVLGASRREAGRRANEVERRVKLNKPFYVGQFEVTNGQYRQFQKKHTSQQLGGNSLDFGKQPVSSISWLDAAKFCNWLSQSAGLDLVYEIEGDRLLGSDITANGYRLPTEAEWAWLARIQDDGARLTFPWGSKTYPPPAKVENYADLQAKNLLGRSVPNYDDGYIVAAEVGRFAANSKGLHDLGGNVAEWTHDFYSVDVNKGAPLLNPAGPASGRDHVIRGSSWRHGSRTELRLSFRESGSEPRLDVGLRVVRNIE